MSRRGAGLALAIAALWCAVSASSAGAADGSPLPAFDPQTTNIPYLAWRGEEVRLVHCVPLAEDEPWAMEGTSEEDGSDAYNARWTLEPWTGYPFQRPELVPGTQRFFTDDEEESEHFTDNCVKANFISQRAGLAVVHLVVENQAEDIVETRQFLVGWLQLNAPALTSNTPETIGAGTEPPSRLLTSITGTLPLLSYENEDVTPEPAFPTLPAHIRLPAEEDGSTYWDELAHAVAATSDPRLPYQLEPWRMWDIHDDSLDSRGHVAGECEAEEAGMVEAVDSCLGGSSDDGPFSRIWGDVTDGIASWGPFDPVRPSETFMGDGKLDAGDVPLPPARIDVEILDDPIDPVDGVGYLRELDKSDVYARDWGSDDIPHNAYAPFYVAHIPAARAEFADHAGVASGTDVTNDPAESPTYLTCTAAAGGPTDSCAYEYWRIARTLRSAEGGDTACAQRLDGAEPLYYRTPAGAQAVVVYTDEHGEAMVEYVPGYGFYLDEVLRRAGEEASPGEPCDIQRLSELGHVKLQATARYPGRSVLDPPKVSGTLSKRVINLFDRQVRCALAGGSTPTLATWTCTASASDLDGWSADSEGVCFATDHGAGVAPLPASAPHTVNGSQICETTELGRAQVEVSGSCTNGTIPTTVSVEFAGVRLSRSTKVSYACPAPAPPPSPPTGGGPSTPSAPSAPPSAPPASPPASPINPAPGAPPAAPTTPAKLVLARIQKLPKSAGRVVVVRVNSKANAELIEVRLVKANGRTLRRVKRSVRTNGVVTVRDLKLDKTVTRVVVTILGSGTSGGSGSAAPAPAAKVVTSVIRRDRSGRFVMVQVRGSSAAAKIEVRLVKANGRTLRRVSRTIPTNRLVRVPNLKLDSIVKRVEARVKS